MSAIKNKMKVLLYAGFKDNTVFYSAVSPPLGLYRLKNFLERRGINCDVHDLSLHENNFKDTKEKISKGYYDVIGISVDSEKMGRYFTLLRDIRKRIDNLNQYAEDLEKRFKAAGLDPAKIHRIK